MAKERKDVWFIRTRGSYLPTSWQGALTYIPFLAYLVFSAEIAYNHSSSTGYTFFLVFPQWIAAAVVMHWLAARKS